jgi:hypothetical protein
MAGTDVDEAIRKIRSGDFKTGWAIFNGIRTKRALAKAELEAAHSALADQLIGLEERQRQAKLSQAKTEAAKEDIRLETELKLALHSLEVENIEFQKVDIKAKTKLTNQAADKGLTIESDQKLRVAESESTIKVGETRELSQIKIDEAKQMGEDELRREITKMQEQVRLAIIADKLGEHQMIEMIVEQQTRIYEKIQGIEQNPSLSERTKRRMLNDLEEFVLTLKEDRRAREDRLLQAGNRQGLREVRETTELRGDYRKDPKTGEE